MKNTIIAILCSCSLLSVAAQDVDKGKYALTTSSTTVGAGSVSVLDPYLSPFDYSGIQLRALYSSRRFFKPENDKISYSHRLLFDAGTGSHPTGRNTMQFFNLNYMFGASYHFRPLENLMALAGVSWDLDLGGKYLGRNVNNPFSLDLYTDINATAEVQYLLKLKKWLLRVQYGAFTPIAGCMFVPMQNISYYELFALNNTKDAFHFSSPHNKHAWSHYLNLDIPIKISTLRLSVQHDYIKYSANDLVFRKNDLMITVGTVVHFYTFKGTKNRIPDNFVNAYE